MRFKTTVWLFIAVMLLSGMIWWAEEDVFRIEGKRDIPSGSLFPKPEWVDVLSIETEEFVLTGRRENGTWRLVSPIDARADSSALNRLMLALSELSIEDVITPEERHDAGALLHDYGLKSPAVRIAWSGLQGEGALRIGHKTPIGDTLYVLPEGAHRIAIVSARLLDIIPESVHVLRDRVLFYGDPRRVHRIEIRRPGGFLQIQRLEDGHWRIQQPFMSSADPIVIRNWLEQIFEWRIQEFVADSVSDASVYGLDESAVQITVWGDGEETGQSLWLNAAPNQEDAHVYARRGHGQSIFSLLPPALETVRVRPNDWRDRALLSGHMRDVRWIRVERGDDEVVLQRGEANGWWVMYPKRWPADPARISDLLSAWSGARIETFLEGTDMEQEAAAYRILFTSAPPPALWSKEIEVLNNETEDNRLRVRRNNEPTIYKIDREVLYSTVADPLYYRKRKVIELDPSTILQVRQSINGRDKRVERDATAHWIRLDKEVAFDAAHIERVVQELSQLEADEFVEDSPSDWSVYGLQTPATIWRLRLDPSVGTGRVLWLGNIREDGRRYARTLGEEVVFLLNPAISALLMKDPWPTLAQEDVPGE